MDCITCWSTIFVCLTRLLCKSDDLTTHLHAYSFFDYLFASNHLTTHLLACMLLSFFYGVTGWIREIFYHMRSPHSKASLDEGLAQASLCAS